MRNYISKYKIVELTPQQYLKLGKYKKHIKETTIIPPVLGRADFGLIEVEFNSILIAMEVKKNFGI